MESQEIEMALNTLTISPIEITIIGLISLIGVLSNIFCITVLNKRLHIKVYTRLIHIVISVILSSTICITIDPYIIAIEVRFIFLAPLIIGLISPELIFYMTKVTTASQVLEYILSFTCIKKNADVKLPESPVESSLVDIKETPKDDNKEIVNTDSKDLQKRIAEIGFAPSTDTVYKIDITTEYLKKKIEDLIQEYTIDYPLLADQEEIFKLKCMGIEAEMAEINKALMNINDLPTETAYKISETIKLYHKLVNMTTTSK